MRTVDCIGVLMVSGLLAGLLTMIGAVGFVGGGSGFITSRAAGFVGSATGGGSTAMATGGLTSCGMTGFVGTSTGGGILATTTGGIGGATDGVAGAGVSIGLAGG